MTLQHPDTFVGMFQYNAYFHQILKKRMSTSKSITKKKTKKADNNNG